MNSETPAPRIPPRQQLIQSERWPVVGERQPARREGDWSLNISGLVEQPQQWSLDALGRLGWADYTIDIHCVTRWSKLGMVFTGLPLARLLRLAVPSSAAKFVSFVACSERRHSSSMRLQDALQMNAILAVSADGVPLPEVHGGPLRLVVPGRYFYKSVKWLEEIELLAEDRLGFWESTAGYHNEADPWQEQRFLATTISRQEAAQLLLTRDFTGRDLRGINASHRDLSGLRARAAQLRDANFCDARLANADFREANLSNARFDNSDLRGADFTGADVEGASFVDADLRRANLRVASMFGASFCVMSVDGTLERAARVDDSTQWNFETLSSLTESQWLFLRRQGVAGSAEADDD